MAQTERVVTIGPQGRIVIPATARRELGLKEGTAVAIRVDGQRLILEPRAEVLRRVRRRYSAAGAKGLTRELIADRREEGRRESGR